MATKKTTKSAKSSSSVRAKKTVEKVQLFGLELSYFVIPLVILAIACLDKYFMFVGYPWVKTLQTSGISHPWAHYVLWYASYMYTTLALVIFWDTHQRDQKFLEVVSALGVNIFCLIGGYYLFFINHSIGGGLALFIGAFLSIDYVIYRLWSKYQLVASLLVPYAIAMLYAIYVTHSVWMLN